MTTTKALFQFVSAYCLINPERILFQHYNSTCQFFKYHEEMTDVSQFSSQHVANWVKYLEQHGLRVSAIHRKLYSLKIFFQWLVEIGILSSNPCEGVNDKKYSPTSVDILSRQTLQQLYRLVQSRPKDRLIIDLVFSGIRWRNELIHIKINDIDLDNKALHIHSLSRPQKFWMSEQCCQSLKSYLSTQTNDSEFLFGSPNQSGRYIQKMLNRCAELLGLEALSIGLIRRSCLSSLSSSPHFIDSYKKLSSNKNEEKVEIAKSLFRILPDEVSLEHAKDMRFKKHERTDDVTQADKE